jgi:hypothetical protein
MVIPFIALSHPISKKEKGKKYPSFYQKHIVIDGKADEWADSLFFLNPDAKIRYAVVNDSNNLYLCLKVFDDNQQLKLLRGGMEVWIDPAGKKTEICGIRYPLSTTLNPGGKAGWHSGDPNVIKQFKLLFLLQAKDMELTGFKDGINGLLSNVINRTGVQAIIKLDSANILIYEAKIPLKIFKTDLTQANPLSVGFIIKGLEHPKMQGGEDSREGGMENHEGRSGMGGGFGGGGRGGHGGEGHSHQQSNQNEGGDPGTTRQTMFEDTSMWLKLSIAH